MKTLLKLTILLVTMSTLTSLVVSYNNDRNPGNNVLSLRNHQLTREIEGIADILTLRGAIRTISNLPVK